MARNFRNAKINLNKLTFRFSSGQLDDRWSAGQRLPFPYEPVLFLLSLLFLTSSLPLLPPRPILSTPLFDLGFANLPLFLPFLPLLLLPDTLTSFSLVTTLPVFFAVVTRA